MDKTRERRRACHVEMVRLGDEVTWRIGLGLARGGREYVAPAVGGSLQEDLNVR